jgi:hypothetical protein
MKIRIVLKGLLFSMIVVSIFSRSVIAVSTYKVYVKGNVKGADVYLDSIYKGNTSGLWSPYCFTISNVESGTHVIKVSFEGFTTESKSETVTGNKEIAFTQQGITSILVTAATGNAGKPIKLIADLNGPTLHRLTNNETNGRTVKFYVDDNYVGSAVTFFDLLDPFGYGNGKCEYTLTETQSDGLTSGSHVSKVVFDRDTDYASSSATGVVSVKLTSLTSGIQVELPAGGIINQYMQDRGILYYSGDVATLTASYFKSTQFKWQFCDDNYDEFTFGQEFNININTLNSLDRKSLYSALLSGCNSEQSEELKRNKWIFCHPVYSNVYRTNLLDLFYVDKDGSDKSKKTFIIREKTSAPVFSISPTDVKKKEVMYLIDSGPITSNEYEVGLQINLSFKARDVYLQNFITRIMNKCSSDEYKNNFKSGGKWDNIYSGLAAQEEEKIVNDVFLCPVTYLKVSFSDGTLPMFFDEKYIKDLIMSKMAIKFDIVNALRLYTNLSSYHTEEYVRENIIPLFFMDNLMDYIFMEEQLTFSIKIPLTHTYSIRKEFALFNPSFFVKTVSEFTCTEAGVSKQIDTYIKFSPSYYYEMKNGDKNNMPRFTQNYTCGATPPGYDGTCAPVVPVPDSIDYDYNDFSCFDNFLKSQNGNYDVVYDIMKDQIDKNFYNRMLYDYVSAPIIKVQQEQKTLIDAINIAALVLVFVPEPTGATKLAGASIIGANLAASAIANIANYFVLPVYTDDTELAKQEYMQTGIIDGAFAMLCVPDVVVGFKAVSRIGEMRIFDPILKTYDVDTAFGKKIREFLSSKEQLPKSIFKKVEPEISEIEDAAKELRTAIKTGNAEMQKRWYNILNAKYDNYYETVTGIRLEEAGYAVTYGEAQSTAKLRELLKTNKALQKIDGIAEADDVIIRQVKHTYTRNPLDQLQDAGNQFAMTFFRDLEGTNTISGGKRVHFLFTSPVEIASAEKGLFEGIESYARTYNIPVEQVNALKNSITIESTIDKYAVDFVIQGPAFPYYDAFAAVYGVTKIADLQYENTVDVNTKVVPEFPVETEDINIIAEKKQTSIRVNNIISSTTAITEKYEVVYVVYSGTTSSTVYRKEMSLRNNSYCLNIGSWPAGTDIGGYIIVNGSEKTTNSIRINVQSAADKPMISLVQNGKRIYSNNSDGYHINAVVTGAVSVQLSYQVNSSNTIVNDMIETVAGNGKFSYRIPFKTTGDSIEYSVSAIALGGGKNSSGLFEVVYDTEAPRISGLCVIGSEKRENMDVVRVQPIFTVKKAKDLYSGLNTSSITVMLDSSRPVSVDPASVHYDDVTCELTFKLNDIVSVGTHVFNIFICDNAGNSSNILTAQVQVVSTADVPVFPLSPIDNPTKNTTKLQVQAPPGYLSSDFKIFNKEGVLVRTVIETFNVSIVNPDVIIEWDGKDDAGANVPVGGYIGCINLNNNYGSWSKKYIIGRIK